MELVAWSIRGKAPIIFIHPSNSSIAIVTRVHFPPCIPVWGQKAFSSSFSCTVLSERVENTCDTAAPSNNLIDGWIRKEARRVLFPCLAEGVTLTSSPFLLSGICRLQLLTNAKLQEGVTGLASLFLMSQHHTIVRREQCFVRRLNSHDTWETCPITQFTSLAIHYYLRIT